MAYNMGEQVSVEDVEDALATIVDPEIGLPILELKIVDKILIEGGDVSIDFHLTAPLCPPFFALKIATDIKEAVSKIKGVKSVKVNLKQHYLADMINKEVNK